MDEAARVIEDAIVGGRSCAVLADYDVDGGSSAAQLVRYFRARGRELKIYVPDRMKEGYGPSALAFERLKAEGVELVITVDCGAAAEGPLNAAAELGLDVIVLDHHLMAGPPPKARAVVNPNRLDCRSGQGDLTAAGVVLVTHGGGEPRSAPARLDRVEQSARLDADARPSPRSARSATSLR